MSNRQTGILQGIPAVARYVMFSIDDAESVPEALEKLASLVDGEEVVVGFGASLLSLVGSSVETMRLFPSLENAGIEIPATHGALWCWIRGVDRGTVIHKERVLLNALFPGFAIEEVVDAFKHGSGNDLTGYEDGTENPQGEDAIQHGFASGMGEGIDGSSFVAVQQWVHNLDKFEFMDPEEQDHTIGRRKGDNVELADAPESAHVKRTAQEDFTPEAFSLRRSMPWANESDEGLNFVSFGCSFDAFEAQLKKMIGLEDGIVDALFRFTKPVTGAYYWCPPMKDGKLDLSAIKVVGA